VLGTLQKRLLLVECHLKLLTKDIALNNLFNILQTVFCSM
jgi:hypothetical protein